MSIESGGDGGPSTRDSMCVVTHNLNRAEGARRRRLYRKKRTLPYTKATRRTMHPSVIPMKSPGLADDFADDVPIGRAEEVAEETLCPYPDVAEKLVCDGVRFVPLFEAELVAASR